MSGSLRHMKRISATTSSTSFTHFTLLSARSLTTGDITSSFSTVHPARTTPIGVGNLPERAQAQP
jgi:hypothetical protein